MATLQLKNRIKNSEPIADVPKETYRELFALINGLGLTQGTEPENERIRYIYANNAYVINEFLRGIDIREINYELVKNFAIKHKDVIQYLLSEYFKLPLEKFENWIQVEIDMLECSMHSATSRKNKDVYH